MAKKELFKNKLFACVLRSIGCVPVDRSGGDLKAMRTCIRILKENNPHLKKWSANKHHGEYWWHSFDRDSEIYGEFKNPDEYSQQR